MNKVFLKGKIATPELKYSSSGNAYCNFSLATSEGKKDAAGNWTNETEWHNCVAFGKNAERVVQAGKGGNLVVIGKIKTETYEKDNQKKYITKIICDHVESWASPGKGETASSQSIAQTGGYADTDLIPF